MFTSCYTQTSGLELIPKANELSVAASKKLQQQRLLLGKERHNRKSAECTALVVREAFTAVGAGGPSSKYIKVNGRELIGLMRSLRMWSGVLRRRLEREFVFQTSDAALQFVNYVHGLSSRLNHYPKITMIKMRVIVQLRTTEVDGISTRDIELARLIDELPV